MNPLDQQEDQEHREHEQSYTKSRENPSRASVSNGSKQILGTPSRQSMSKSFAEGSVIDNDFEGKAEALERALSRVTNKQDALLPLMNLLDLKPSMEKNKIRMKDLDKKFDKTTERIASAEQQLMANGEKTQEGLDAIRDRLLKHGNDVDSVKFERKLKNAFYRVADQHQKLTDLKNKIEGLEQGTEEKAQSEVKSISKTVESQLDEHRKSTIESLKALKEDTSGSLGSLKTLFEEIMRRVFTTLAFTSALLSVFLPSQ